eukprot:9480351-Pyramimonas_sp.AAC.1
MGPILHRAQLTKQADIGLWTFVDDTVLRSQGTEANVEKQLIDNGAMLGECLKEAGLTVSPKTTVIASSPKLAIAIAKGLQQRGIPAKAEGNFTDLGVDCNAASMRTRRKGRQRMQKAARRAHAIRRMRRMARLKVVTKGLWTTGARAQGTYGHQ